MNTREVFNQGLKILNIALEHGKYSELARAIDKFNLVIKEDETFAPAYLTLAYIATLMEYEVEAVKLLNKVLDLEPFNRKAQTMLKDLKSKPKSNLEVIDKKQEFLSILEEQKKIF